MPLRGEGRCACAPHAHAPNRGGRRGNFLGNQLRSPVLPLSPQCAASPGILLSSSEMTKRSATAQPGHRLPSRCFLRLPEGRCERSRVFCCMGWAGYGPSSPLRGAAVPCAIGTPKLGPSATSPIRGVSLLGSQPQMAEVGAEGWPHTPGASPAVCRICPAGMDPGEPPPAQPQGWAGAALSQCAVCPVLSSLQKGKFPSCNFFASQLRVFPGICFHVI